MPLIQFLVPQIMNLREQLKDSWKVTSESWNYLLYRLASGFSIPTTLKTFQERTAGNLSKLDMASHSFRSDETLDWRTSVASLSCIRAISSTASGNGVSSKTPSSTSITSNRLASGFSIPMILKTFQERIAGNLSKQDMNNMFDVRFSYNETVMIVRRPLRAVEVMKLGSGALQKLLYTVSELYQVSNASVCLTIGAYSKWLDASPNGLLVLPLVIEILMSGMSGSEDSAAAAALAFRHICDGSSRAVLCLQLYDMPKMRKSVYLIDLTGLYSQTRHS
ncbi:hypothetical protein C5167_042622 [Papaver somniferum]|uniref:Uncharacterized protein n=1 Tax=Papaver somniferum TaxID=3469 RepID=A0A4Y7L4D5_PAPSO|nr:hypothetical protein C5167_042622 [Papaver somniferum]